MNRLIVLGVLLSLATACHENKQAEGPAERAGKRVDRAAETTEQKLKTAVKETDVAAHHAVHNTGAAIEEAGQKLKGEGPAPAAAPAAPKKSE